MRGRQDQNPHSARAGGYSTHQVNQVYRESQESALDDSMQQEGGSSEGLDEDEGTYRPTGQSRVERGRNSRVSKM
jgi:hypothetical protein